MKNVVNLGGNWLEKCVECDGGISFLQCFDCFLFAATRRKIEEESEE